MGCRSSKHAPKAPEDPNEIPTSASLHKPLKGMDYLVNSVCVMLIRAGNLENKDVVGTSDPYAVIRMGSQEYSTRVIAGELNPVFNERFSFLVPVQPSLPVCNITLYDRDRAGSSTEKLGRVRYLLSEKDYTLASQSHWLCLDGARSGQAKLRSFAVTLACLSLRFGETQRYVLVPCMPNSTPFPKARVTCVVEGGGAGNLAGSFVLNMIKLFQHRTKRGKAVTVDYVVDSDAAESHNAPHNLPLAAAEAVSRGADSLVGDSASGFGGASSAAASSTASRLAAMGPVDVATLSLPSLVLSGAVTAKKITMGVSFVLSTTMVDDFQSSFDTLSTAPDSASVTGSAPGAGVGSAGAGAGALSTEPSRSVASGVVSATTPRSMASYRTGQAGYGIGLSLLQSKPTLAGTAAGALRELTSAMDHLLEHGPHPASPFVPSSAHRRLRSMATSGTLVPMQSLPAPTPQEHVDPDVVFYPSWKFPPAPAEGLSLPVQKLQEKLAVADNQQCADCQSMSPSWAVMEHGCFVCSPCATVYLAAEASTVRSVYDPKVQWTEQEVEGLAGNEASNAAVDSAIKARLKAINPDTPWLARTEHIATKRGFPVPKALMPSSSSEFQRTPRGQVYVIASRAKDLQTKEPFGYSDPRCVVSLGSTTRKTRTIENSLNPRWDENLLAFSWDGVGLLHVQVFDRDTFDGNTCGHTWIMLLGIPDGVEQVLSMPLHGSLSGTVTLQITFHRC